MHKFERGEQPVNLKKMKQLHQNWKSFCETMEHIQLGDALYERQEHYCAYCETIISQKNRGHIEHLERRSDNPNRAFDWSNMFFSCTHSDSCGKFKDESKPHLQFQPADIIDPSQEDPLDFFRYDTNGGISPRDESHKKKANKTMRIFNLDKSPRLKGIRSSVAQTVASFLEKNPTEDDITDFLNSLDGCDCISVYYSLCNRKMA